VNDNGIRRVALSTGGGDAPGLNAVIRAAVLAGIRQGWEMYGIRDGYNGLLLPERFPDGGLMPLDAESVKGITHLGGTILGTTNRGNPSKFPAKRPDGTWEEVDRMDELIRSFGVHQLDAVIIVGGDGSLGIANDISERGIRVIGVPKTIDNDLDETVITFGFDTAVAFATEALDRLHSTAASHGRVIVVEVMGRYAGWIATNSGVAGSADAILIPEIPYDLAPVAEKIRERDKSGRQFSIVVVAEGARPKDGGRSVVDKEVGMAERLGGAGKVVADQLAEMLNKDVRHVVLGHLLRGGSPSAFDRLLGLRFGAAAIRGLATDHRGVMVALDPPEVKYVPLAAATHRMKTVPLDSDTIMTARAIGICLGD
jgi:6-phosphofructokinase 1